MSKITFMYLGLGGPDQKNHDIIEIGAVTIGDDRKVCGEFERKVSVSPERSTRGWLAFNGYNKNTWVRESVGLFHALSEFRGYLSSHADIDMVGWAGSAPDTPYYLSTVATINPTHAGYLKNACDRLNIYMPVFPNNWDLLQLQSVAMFAGAMGDVPFRDFSFESLLHEFDIEYGALALSRARAMQMLYECLWTCIYEASEYEVIKRATMAQGH